MIRKRVPLAILTAGATCCALGALPSGAAESSVRCERDNTRTVIETERARVFRRSGRLYGCLRKDDRPYLLVATRVDSEAPRPQLAGRFVGYTWVAPGAPETDTELRSFDLRTGKVKRRTPTYKDPLRLDSMVLNRRGSLAWTVTDTTHRNTPDLVDTRVYKLDDRGQTLLDQSSGDGSYRLYTYSLAIDAAGNYVYWLAIRSDAGGPRNEPHSAVLY